MHAPSNLRWKATLSVGVRSEVRVLTEEARHELMRLNRQWLLDHPPEKTVGQNVQPQP